jgi:hypothetical protein
MSRFTYDNFAEQFRATVPGFDRIYDEHVADYAQVLPHVLFGDLVRFLSSEVALRGAGSVALKQAMLLLEAGMGCQDPRVQELVAVSFLENLDRHDTSFPAIRSLFGPRLEEQYRQYSEAATTGNSIG